MCGILGFNWEDTKLLRRGLNEIKHRGPDNSGKFSDKRVSLGHNRLSIIDLSKSGNQPMFDSKKEIAIIFNGEIYNHSELRVKLKEKYKFKSQTDTEVLIYLYKEHGPDFLKKLNGMFAICIYDKKKQQLFLARDRLGIKPLYYYKKEDKFMFASEIKAILQNKRIKREVNPEALQYYLAFRANTSDKSFIKDISKIPPGHSITYELRSNKLSLKKYWDLPRKIKTRTKKESTEILKNLLEDSVRLRLMSDVPYGAYLSGGVDSGTIVSLMGKYSSKSVKTFSVGFREDEHSETKEAKFLAGKLKTEHHELLISKDSIKQLPKIVYQSDEPSADPTIIPTYFLAKYNKKYCTVILTGEGSDELFAGYPQYKFMKIHQTLLRYLPRLIRRLLIKTIKATPKSILNIGFKYSEALGEKAMERFSNYVLSNNPSEQLLNQLAVFNQEEQSELLGKKVNLYNKFSEFFKTKNNVTNSQELELKNAMVEDLLMKVEKNTMASSVEGRVPFLDHRIVEFAFETPSEFKLKGFTKDKHLLREAMREILPRQTKKRKKHHFFVPIDSWLSKDLKPLIEKFLSKEFVEKQGIFNYSYIEKLRKGFDKSRLYYARQLWALVIFQIWYMQYIEGKSWRVMTTNKKDFI